jgi:hypothetical protein
MFERNTIVTTMNIVMTNRSKEEANINSGKKLEILVLKY